MKYTGNSVEKIKIAYIGGGSRGWAWGLMSDLASAEDISGDVWLYDIDFTAAKYNEQIGEMYKSLKETRSRWNYHAADSAKEALENADFVIISILPGTFDEMESDVHTPEKYGIFQSVGDSTGPGGIIRAMRTIPMYEVIAENIKKYCPNAWVINYTNPMTLCVKTLYRVFPQVKAFGCCHEVFGTQKVLAEALKQIEGIENVKRDDVKVNPVAVNHFTWLTSATYKNMDLFPVYRKFSDKFSESGIIDKLDKNWMNAAFKCNQKVKLDLFNKYGYIAAAGDRHLAEFCPGNWYLKDRETVEKFGFGLTSVKWRKENLEERLKKSEDLRSGKEELKIECTGEEGVKQIRAILGLCELITNVNMPNIGQIPNLPTGAIVETNAIFRAGTVTPVFSGKIPESISPLVARICAEQELVSKSTATRDLNGIFSAFSNDPLVTCSLKDSKSLFDEMLQNTKEYLSDYNF